MRGILDIYFETFECNHNWKSLDNPFGSLYHCNKCDSYLVNGVLQQ